MILLDTNVVSDLMRPQPDAAVRRWLAGLGDTPLATTAITIAEIVYGLRRLPPGRRRQALEASFEALAGPGSPLPVLTFDDIAAREAGRLRALREAAGFEGAASDMMIAGLCTVVGASLATRNVRDFTHLPVTVIDPWRDL